MTALLVITWVLAACDRPADISIRAIAGIEVGSSVHQARRLLAPSGRSESRALGAGAKEVWTFDSGGYAWIAYRSDRDGRIVWLTGRRRPGCEIPFDAIGAPPAVVTDAIAIWHSRGAYSGQRLTLRGAGRRAQVVTLLAMTE